ncbi:hypothetical protein PTTG_27242 [Puccinia triticina 1-1 BBBD Race 1]|uniref:Uncharacterized protein n=1 Tax=Puccinia triticina (isolate 1-1 / race 1 (BBBD)) TaxID=630390 RepID=A0A180GML1_PUCT1|nr:hypothetical protein PTTG_27242 [Puccinia triticina 1-1 BBBD Race 1]
MSGGYPNRRRNSCWRDGVIRPADGHTPTISCQHAPAGPPPRKPIPDHIRHPTERQRTMPRTSADSSTISDLTRAKLAGELILPLTHQRRGPCLRKLVHWSNLLSVLTVPASIERTDAGEAARQPPTAPNEPEDDRWARPAGRADVSREQAECDWFDHLLEEIDDSDSESESSDGLPDPALLHNILPAPPSVPPESCRGRSSRRKRLWMEEELPEDAGRDGRRRRLLARPAPGPRRARRPSRRPRARRDPAGLGLPHWGFLCVRPTEEELKTTAEDDEDSHLPSLVPIKPRPRVQALIHHPLQHPATTAPSPIVTLDAIDFRSYDFIIAADALLDGQTVLVKYLVGGYNGHPRPPSSSFLHPHTHHQHSAGLGHASHDHPLIDARRGSAARRTPAPKHPDIRVTKLHIVLNHLSLPSPAAPPAGRPKEDVNLGLDGRLSPDYLDQPASDPHQILLWRVFAIGNPCPF